RRQEQGVVLADDAVHGVGGVRPVDEDADHRVVDGPQPCDRLSGAREVPLHHVGRPPEFLQRGDQLVGRLAGLREGPLVRPGAIITGPEDRDSLRHKVPRPRVVGRHEVRWTECISPSLPPPWDTPDGPRRWPWTRSPLRRFPAGLLAGDPAGEAVDINDTTAMDAPRDRLDIIAGLDLEGHDW